MKWRAVNSHGLEPVQEPGEPAAAFVFGLIRQYRAYRQAGGKRYLALPERPADVSKAYWPGIRKAIQLCLCGRNRGMRRFPEWMREATEPPAIVRHMGRMKTSRVFQIIKLFKRALKIG
jgi:hypothetical protein